MTDADINHREVLGIRLILLSLVLAVMSGIVSYVVPIILTASTVDASSYVLHTLILPGLGLGLLTVVALVGSAGIFLVERERSPISLEPGRGWDRARTAIVTAVLAVAALVSSGIVLGLVYLPAHAGWTAVRFGAVFAAVLGIGLYLFWTAERVAPRLAKSMGMVALGLGIGSAAIGIGTSALIVFRLVDLESVPTGLELLALAGFLAGLLSLLVWIIVFSRLGGAFPPESEPGQPSKA